MNKKQRCARLRKLEEKERKLLDALHDVQDEIALLLEPPPGTFAHAFLKKEEERVFLKDYGYPASIRLFCEVE